MTILLLVVIFDLVIGVLQDSIPYTGFVLLASRSCNWAAFTQPNFENFTTNLPRGQVIAGCPNLPPGQSPWYLDIMSLAYVPATGPSTRVTGPSTSPPDGIRATVFGSQYTATEVHRGTGLSISHISRLAARKRRPSITTLRKLARFLGMTMEEVAGRCKR